MYKKSPEQKYLRKKLLHKTRRSYYSPMTFGWKVEEWEWGNHCQTEISEEGKKYVVKYKERNKK